MGDKTDIPRGTPALTVLKTLKAMAPPHGYGVARRIEQASGEPRPAKYGAFCPAPLKLEREGSVSSEWGACGNGRKGRYCRLTRAGCKRLTEEARERGHAAAIAARLFARAKES